MTWAPMVDVSRDPRWGRARRALEKTHINRHDGQNRSVEAMRAKVRANRYSGDGSQRQHFAGLRRGEGGRGPTPST
ncbi:hypothetical protein ACVXG7_22120 [Enterobacter hormaechei]